MRATGNAELDRRDHRLDRALHRLERADGRRHRFGQAEQAHRDLGDDAERPFRADEQPRQVVARRRLARAPAGADDAAVGEHHRQPEHRLAHRAVAHRGRARRARRGHAADRRVGARIDPEGTPVLASALFSCRCVTPASTVASRSSALTRSTRFIRERSIETPPLTALTCPSSDGADAERDDRRAVARGNLIDGAHLVGGRSERRRRRVAGRVPRFAVAVVLELRRVGRAAIAEDPAQIGDQRGPGVVREDGGHGRDCIVEG